MTVGLGVGLSHSLRCLKANNIEVRYLYQQLTLDFAVLSMSSRMRSQRMTTFVPPGQVLDSWRRSLVGAMRQGYFLIIKMGDSNLDMKGFCRDDIFPYCVFTSGEVEAQGVREPADTPKQ